MPKTVIIVGMLAPWDREMPEDAEIWSCNWVYKKQPNLARLYFFDKEFAENEEWCRDANALGVPIITTRHYPHLPKSKPYPLVERVREHQLPYFTSTLAYIFADAISAGAEKIVMHRINSFTGSFDYLQQVQCLNAWMAYALGKGIKISRSSDSTLLSPSPWEPQYYGYLRYRHEDAGHSIMATAARAAGQLPLDVTHNEVPKELLRKRSRGEEVLEGWVEKFEGAA